MSSERPKENGVPRVTRGFPKGESIEVGRERLSARIRATMPEDRVDLMIIEKSHENFLSLPHLAPESLTNLPSWIPRYEPVSGAVYTTRWGGVDTQITLENQQNLAEVDKFIIIKQPAYVTKVNLEAYPKSWETILLIPQRLDTIEAAMRQQDEIRHDYGVVDGVEQQEAETLMLEIFKLTEIFQRKGEVDINTLGNVAARTLSIFDALAISVPKDEVKRRLVTSMLRASQPDRLGRVNPMISRILYRSAYLNAVRREIIARLTREKSNRIFWLLYAERFGTRVSLENAKAAIAALAGFELQRGHSVLTEELFRAHPKRILDADITEIRIMIKAIAETTLKPVRAAPYLASAKLAEAILTSETFRDKRETRLMKETLTYYGLASEAEKPSTEDLIMARKPAEAQIRARHAYSVLQSVLNDPDNSEYTVF